MGFFDTTWYVNFGDGATTGHYAVAKRPQNTAVAAGQIVRQFTAPAVGNERVFVCIVAGTTANTTDATWVLTRGVKTTDGTATWQECTGISAVNGDLVNTLTWSQFKALGNVSNGVIIKRNNGASYQICTNAVTMGTSEPTFSDTAGVTASDASSTWTSLGPVSNFTGGQAPHARLANVFGTNWFASGNMVYVGDNHAETQSTNMTLSPTSALLAKILCHNHSGSYPPAASDITTGATVTNTASSITFTAQGSFYIYGLTFVTGVSSTQFGFAATAVGQVQNWYCLDNCSISIGNNSSIFLGASGTAWGVVVFNNTTVKFGNTSSYILPAFAQITWQNTGSILVTGSAVPATLFQLTSGSGRFSNITLNNLDLSQLTGSLFTNASNSSIGTLVVQDCKLNPAMTVTRPINTGMNVQLIRSDSAGTSYKSQRIAYEGTETTETSIVRTGGAVDPTGQAQSRKIVTTVDAQWLRPFKAEPMVIWNAVTGANVTATVYGTVNAGALPMNDDLWLECEYLGDAGAVAVFATLDGTPVNATLSNGNLTVTHSNTSQGGGRSAAYKTSGKYYFEVTVGTTNGNQDCLSMQPSAGTYASALAGNGSVTCYFNTAFFNTWNLAANGGNSGRHTGAIVAGNKIGVAVDLDNKKVWCRVNNGGWNGLAIGSENPASNVGGVTGGLTPGAFAPMLIFDGGLANDTYTINFGQTAYAFTPPSGFVDWGTPAVPASPLGKLVTTTKSSVLASNAAVSSDSSVWSNTSTPVTTFNGVNTNVTLSNGNLTATHSNTTNDSGARSADVRSNGKWYFEVTIGATHGVADTMGILASGGSYNDMASGSVNLTGYATASGNVRGGGVVTGNLGAGVAGDVIAFAINKDAQLAWVRRNNGNWNGSSIADPVTGVGGAVIQGTGASSFGPAVGFSGAGTLASDSFTANFGLSAYFGTPPAGFGNWGSWVPFKLTATLSSPQPQLAGYLHARVRAAKPSTTFYIDPQVTLT